MNRWLKRGRNTSLRVLNRCAFFLSGQTRTSRSICRVSIHQRFKQRDRNQLAAAPGPKYPTGRTNARPSLGRVPTARPGAGLRGTRGRPGATPDFDAPAGGFCWALVGPGGSGSGLKHARLGECTGRALTLPALKWPPE